MRAYVGYDIYVEYCSDKSKTWQDLSILYGYKTPHGAYSAAMRAAIGLGMDWPVSEGRKRWSLSGALYEQKCKTHHKTWEECFRKLNPGAKIRWNTGSIACNLAKSYAKRRGKEWPIRSPNPR